ncbi:UNVERIFIED_CONTAM: E3 ubiquitin-protein ligase msl2 [Gekko kuhli]
MNPVNATALYISASRLVLNYGPGEDPQCLAEIGKLLPYFRQSLSCCVCAANSGALACPPNDAVARRAACPPPNEPWL